MSRWSPQISHIIKMAGQQTDDKHLLDTFFIKRTYEPKTEQEKKDFEEFSLVTSSMSLMIHIAKADKIMHPEERMRIIEDLTYQLEQRPYEYDNLSEKFGKSEKEIILNMYNQLVDDYDKKKIDLEEIIKVINLIYQNNLKKRLYVLRLCYYCAMSDSYYEESEKKVITEIASKLRIPVRERKRIESEIIDEMNQNK